MRTARTEKKSFLRIVSERFAGAVIFGLLVGLLVNSALLQQFSLIARVQQESAELGTRLATTWNDLFARGAQGVPLPDGATYISMVDIDEQTCSALASYVRCRFDRIGHPEVLDSALAAADAADPRVIVLDIYLPTRSEAEATPVGRHLLKRIMSDGPPIVAPILNTDPARTSAASPISINWANSICGKSRCGRLRYAPAFTVERFGSARSYSEIVPINSIASLNAPEDAIDTEMRLASLPFATVALLNGEMPARGSLEPQPIAYTMPSLADAVATGDSHRFALLRARYAYSFDYGPSHLRRMAGPPAIELGGRPGAILIIGTSAPIIDDWHETPAGRAAGMEVVANAIRTMELRHAGQLPQPPSLWLGWVLAVTGWAGIFATTALLVLGERRREAQLAERGLQPGLWPDRYSVLAFGIVALAFALELGLKMIDIVANLRDPMARTGDVDLLFPLLALFFTTGVDLSQRLTRRLERAISAGVDRLARLRSGETKGGPPRPPRARRAKSPKKRHGNRASR